MRRTHARLRPRAPMPSIELEFRLDDGSPWRLTVSPGMERFIGYYPLVDGLDAGGALLRFRTSDPA
ncbi:MAG TPA: hypothetical protein VE053_14300 [Allosphingosinicella sp.]|nr:hypothetical protein [Allosphingosinicella sp.]